MRGRYTHMQHNDIATTRLTGPRGRVSEKCTYLHSKIFRVYWGKNQKPNQNFETTLFSSLILLQFYFLGQPVNTKDVAQNITNIVES